MKARVRLVHFAEGGETSGYFPALAKYHDRLEYQMTFATLKPMAFSRALANEPERFAKGNHASTLPALRAHTNQCTAASYDNDRYRERRWTKNATANHAPIASRQRAN